MSGSSRGALAGIWGHKHRPGPGGHEGSGGSKGGVGRWGNTATQSRVCVTVVMIRGSEGLTEPSEVQMGRGLNHVGPGGTLSVVHWGGRWGGGQPYTIARGGNHPITLTASVWAGEDGGHDLLEGGGPD